MLTLEHCKKILNKDERNFTDKEINEIRSYLYLIGGLQVENNIININANECHNLLPS